jgi:hypothetical protein
MPPDFGVVSTVIKFSGGSQMVEWSASGAESVLGLAFIQTHGHTKTNWTFFSGQNRGVARSFLCRLYRPLTNMKVQ